MCSGRSIDAVRAARARVLYLSGEGVELVQQALHERQQLEALADRHPAGNLGLEGQRAPIAAARRCDIVNATNAERRRRGATFSYSYRRSQIVTALAQPARELVRVSAALAGQARAGPACLDARKVSLIRACNSHHRRTPMADHGRPMRTEARPTLRKAVEGILRSHEFRIEMHGSMRLQMCVERLRGSTRPDVAGLLVTNNTSLLVDV